MKVAVRMGSNSDLQKMQAAVDMPEVRSYRVTS